MSGFSLSAVTSSHFILSNTHSESTNISHAFPIVLAVIPASIALHARAGISLMDSRTVPAPHGALLAYLTVTGAFAKY
jgi:hypothetical protein